MIKVLLQNNNVIKKRKEELISFFYPLTQALKKLKMYFPKETAIQSLSACSYGQLPF